MENAWRETCAAFHLYMLSHLYCELAEPAGKRPNSDEAEHSSFDSRLLFFFSPIFPSAHTCASAGLQFSNLLLNSGSELRIAALVCVGGRLLV